MTPPLLPRLPAFALLLLLAASAGAQDLLPAEAQPGERPAHTRDLPPALPLDEWSEELSLDPVRRRALVPIERWFAHQQAEVQRLKEEDWLAANKRQREVRAELEAKLREALGAEASTELDLGLLFDPILPRVGFRLESSAQVTQRSRFSRGGGSLATYGTTWDLGTRIRLNDSLGLAIGVGGGVTRYEFDDARELDPLDGDPVERLFQSKASLTVFWRPAKRWSVIASLNLNSSGESDASFSDSLTYGGIFGVSYAFTSKLSLGFGVFARTQLEDSPRVFPVPVIRLRVDLSERWRFSFALPEGPRLTFAPIKELELSLTGGLGGAVGAPDSRLDDKRFAPEGVLRQTVLPVKLTADWRPLPFVRLSAELGAIVYRKLEIVDRRGRELTDVRAEPVGFAGVSLQVRF